MVSYTIKGQAIKFNSNFYQSDLRKRRYINVVGVTMDLMPAAEEFLP